MHLSCKDCDASCKIYLNDKPIEDEVAILFTVEAEEHTEHKNRPVQIRGQKRVEIAQRIILEAQSSSTKFVEQEFAANETSEFTEDVCRKILSEYKNKNDFLSTVCDELAVSKWHELVQTAALTYHCSVEYNVLPGFIQEIISHPDFCILMYCEKQLECIKSTPKKNRFLFTDATGNLVSISKIQQTNNVEFNRILNYFCILKDSRYINDNSKDRKKSVLVGEMSSSRHDVYAISRLFESLKFAYETVYSSELLYFRLIVCDYSWATIHAILKSFNLENVEQYAHRVYKLCLGEITFERYDKSWLASCTSHTMHRFVNSLDDVVIDRTIHQFCCFLFSLLLNARSLATMKHFFKLICIVFVSRTATLEVAESLDELRSSIVERKIDESKIVKIIEEVEEKKKRESKIRTESQKKSERKKTIKDASPFTSIFNDIFESIKSKVLETEKESQNDETNFIEFIEFLLFYLGWLCLGGSRFKPHYKWNMRKLYSLQKIWKNTTGPAS